MFASVVIPTYNRRPILEKCLNALEQQQASPLLQGYEVVVVDDGSTDGTPRLAARQQPPLSPCATR
jgi:Glycosyltransferases involved in cell wall biogenesis